MKGSNASGFFFIALTLFFTVAGQLMLKKGMSAIGEAPLDIGSLPIYIWNAVTRPLVFSSLVCAVLAAFAWMAAVSKCDLSFAYPFMGLAIVLTLALTPSLFGERIHLHQWAGVALVCLGIWVASRPY